MEKAPTGSTTPSGGGLNLVTDFEHDDQGRITQSVGPSHQIDKTGNWSDFKQDDNDNGNGTWDLNQAKINSTLLT